MSNQAPNKSQTPTELTPPLINISIHLFFEKFCRGIENRATVGYEFANYLKSWDAPEQYLHVEPTETNPTTLFYVYPIKDWRESIERRKRLEQISENTRQIRFALEQEQREIANKIQRRRDILSEAVADVLKGPAGGKLSKHPKEFTEYLVFRCLIGETPGAMVALGITLELIEEFKSLPVDPAWTNKYWVGSKQ